MSKWTDPKWWTGRSDDQKRRRAKAVDGYRESKAERTAPPAGKVKLVGGLIVAAVAVAIAVPLVGAYRDAEPRDPANEIDAQIFCEEFVKQRLASPDSAEFGRQTQSGDYPTFTADGVVTAENALGVRIQDVYSCTVTHDDESDSWALDELTGLTG